MSFSKGLRIILLTILVCVLLMHRQHLISATATTAVENSHLARNRIARISPRLAVQYSRTRQEPLTDFMDDDDLFELNKRQSDDYGHMRFGKREFDDYGHMRFGRSGSE